VKEFEKPKVPVSSFETDAFAMAPRGRRPVTVPICSLRRAVGISWNVRNALLACLLQTAVAQKTRGPAVTIRRTKRLKFPRALLPIFPERAGESSCGCAVAFYVIFLNTVAI
jgi:hypothetical protein